MEKDSINLQREREKNAHSEKRKIYEGKLLSVEEEKLSFDNVTFQREFVYHPSAVAILPIQNDGHILLIKQYRKAVDEILIELPAGILEKGETPENCAQRELQEEIGYKANKLTALKGFYTTPGFCNEYIHFFLAEDLEKNKLDGDIDENIVSLSLSPSDVKKLILNNTIKDAKTIIGLYRYLYVLKK